MTDLQLQAKLNKLAKLANELDDEAKRRYGTDGSLFFESEGMFHIMTDDGSDQPMVDRQAGIKFSSDIWCQMGAGAW